MYYFETILTFYVIINLNYNYAERKVLKLLSLSLSSLSHIKNSVYLDNIKELTQCFVDHVNPIKIILFGSFANGTFTDESDYDFYLIVDDNRNISQATDDAYNAVTFIKKRPVDIIVGTDSKYKRSSDMSFMVENEVEREGVVLYDRAV